MRTVVPAGHVCPGLGRGRFILVMDEKAFLARTHPLVQRIVADWANTLEHCAAADADDLAQELLARAWAYVKKTGSVPTENIMRDWARDFMRSLGYRGRSGTLQRELPSRGNTKVEELEQDTNGDAEAARGHPRLAPSAELEALRSEFWERLSPALRSQLEELVTVRDERELAALWGFASNGKADINALRAYLTGPLRRRLEREGALPLLERIVRELAR